MRLTDEPLNSSARWPVIPLASRLKRRAGIALVAVTLVAACVDGDRIERIGSARTGAVEPSRGDVSVAGAYLAGRVALDAGDVLAAADQFEIALSAEPDNSDLRRQIFLLRLAGGDLDRAISDAAELVDLGIESDEARLLLAFEALEDERLNDARAQIDDVGPGGISGMVKPLVGAWMSVAMGDEAEGLESIASESGSDGLALVRTYHHASMLMLLDRADEAYALLQPHVGNEQRVPTRLLMALIAAQVRTDRENEALAILDSQLALAPDDAVLADLRARVADGAMPDAPISSPNTGMADALLSLARALSDQRGGSQALLLARLGSYLAPSDGDVWLLIAQQMLSEGNAETALDALDRAGNDTFYAWDTDLLRAQALAQLDRHEEAFRLLRRMGEARPERSDALVMLGDMLRREERYAQSEQAYSDAMERIAEPGPDHWRLLYARGVTLERTKRWPEAEADFLQALELQPEQPLVLNYLGYSWVDQGLHLDRAKGMLRRAVELRPEDGFIVDSLGWAHYRLGEYEDAVTHLERAVELQPDDPVINDHLGDAYWRVGRLREARFQWQRALIFDPEEEVIADIQRKLQTGLPERDRERG